MAANRATRPFKSPGELADAADKDIWDIGLIGAEPRRAEAIAFTPAYAEIEATYLVPSGSALKTIVDIDSAGVRIAVTARTAYGLWLDRNIKHAELIRSETLDSAYDQFVSGKLSALAGLKPRLLSDLEKLPGAHILENNRRHRLRRCSDRGDRSHRLRPLARSKHQARRTDTIRKRLIVHTISL